MRSDFGQAKRHRVSVPDPLDRSWVVSPEGALSVFKPCGQGLVRKRRMLDVFPFPSVDNVPNGFFGNSELLGNPKLWDSKGVKPSHFNHVGFVSFRVWTSTAGALPSLKHLVPIVVSLTANPEMIGIYAQRVIPARAVMADAQSLRHRPSKHHPRGNVGF